MAAQITTLVFTDVVGSSAAKRDTHLGSNAQIRDRVYLEAVQSRHFRLVRGAVAEHRGKELMTMGDAFFLTFEAPLDALRYITGNITKLGEAYIISVTAVNPSNQDTIASAQVQAANKDKVLDALNEVSAAMRQKLGESLASIEKLDAPLGQATTSSLEAFRAFARRCGAPQGP